MRFAALLVALFYIAVGIVGIVSPEGLMTLRGHYLVTSMGLYVGGAIRLAMGLVLILFAPASRAPRVLRVLGVIVCVQGLAAALSSVDRARAMFEFELEAMHSPFVRVGALIALGSGSFMAFAVTPPVRRGLL